MKKLERLCLVSMPVLSFALLIGCRHDNAGKEHMGAQRAELAPGYPRITDKAMLATHLGQYVILEGVLTLSSSKDESVTLINPKILDAPLLIAGFDSQKHGNLLNQRLTLTGKVSRVGATDPRVQGRGEHYVFKHATLQDGTAIYSANPEEEGDFFHEGS